MESEGEATESGRHESAAERLDRNLGELLQELRVIVVGVQVLFAFLLTVAFSQREQALTSADRVLYIVVLLVTAVGAACLVAPAAHHRLVFRQGRKAELVQLANVLATIGLALVGAALAGTIALVCDVVYGAAASVSAGVGSAVLFALLWFGLPLVVLRKTSDDAARSSASR